MLRLPNINAPLEADVPQLTALAARRLKVPEKAISQLTVVKRSVDARDKGDVHFVMTLQLRVEREEEVLRRLKPGMAEKVQPQKPVTLPRPAFERRPVVVGAGPAGLFAALWLARSGARPILIERGKPVDERTRDVETLQQRSELDPDSNVQFGEGGAGAFSDGKLNTGIKSPWIRPVLEALVQHGAPEDILVVPKPHIGTDLLKGVVASIREEIISLGGEVRFSTRMTGPILRGSHVEGIRVRCGDTEDELLTHHVLLCIGHSARDTVQRLYDQGVRMVPKPFAMGVRIEHPQSLIDRSQYGRFAGHPRLGAADYKLVAHTPDGRGCYTFCMCPGGEVICAASQEGGVAVNGMSYHARAGRNANSALLVGVQPKDFGDDHPLAGFALQRSIEKKAFRAGGGDYRAPVQRVADLLEGRATTRLGEVQPTYLPGVTPADLREVLPDFIVQDLRVGIRDMDQRLRGFALGDALLTGPETRSSSPVRMNRLGDGMAEDITGLYPAGEGAGYAGGIVSAAVDGIGAAMAAMAQA